MIHKSNKIAKSVKISGDLIIGKNNIICDNVFFYGKTIIGDDNYIGTGCVFNNKVEIGNKNTFIGNCSIGSQGEMGLQGDRIPDNGKVLIGDSNMFREFITVNFPVFESLTLIKNSCYFMARTHLPHDVVVNNSVTMATNSLIGGHCIAVDPYYLSYKSEMAGYHPEIILSGRKINDSMSNFVYSEVLRLLKEKKADIEENPRILILGASFKENCSDIRNSKVFDLLNYFEDSGFSVDISF